MSDNFHNPLPNFLRNFRTYRDRLPARVSQRALLEIKGNFEKQGYESESGFKNWRGRKRVEKGRKRALLIKSGRLRRSLRAAPLPGMPRVVTDVPYAEALNDGFNGSQSVRGHRRSSSVKVTIRRGDRKVTGRWASGKTHNVKAFTRKMDIPARPFMTVGPSFLNKEEARTLDELENLFLQA